MKIAIGSDHAGFQYKGEIIVYLQKLGHEVRDMGTYSDAPVDYPLFIKGLVRRNIERVFGRLKQWQGYRRARYLGLAKNQQELTLKAVTCNLKRLVKIIELSRA